MLLHLSQKNLKLLFLGVLLSVGITAIKPAMAIPVAQFRAEDVLPILEEFKKEAGLNANQQMLWQQTESKVRALLRTRDARRQGLQETIKAKLPDKNTELRDLAKLMDQDEILSLQENQQLRELWLTMHDALDDRQRDKLVTALMDQLARVADQAKERRPNVEMQKPSGGHRGNKGGAQGGMGGAGNQGGMGQLN